MFVWRIQKLINNNTRINSLICVLTTVNLLLLTSVFSFEIGIFLRQETNATETQFNKIFYKYFVKYIEKYMIVCSLMKTLMQ